MSSCLLIEPLTSFHIPEKQVLKNNTPQSGDYIIIEHTIPISIYILRLRQKAKIKSIYQGSIISHHQCIPNPNSSNIDILQEYIPQHLKLREEKSENENSVYWLIQ
jgi:hypothetical protein